MRSRYLNVIDRRTDGPHTTYSALSALEVCYENALYKFTFDI